MNPSQSSGNPTPAQLLKFAWWSIQGAQRWREEHPYGSDEAALAEAIRWLMIGSYA